MSHLLAKIDLLHRWRHCLVASVPHRICTTFLTFNQPIAVFTTPFIVLLG